MPIDQPINKAEPLVAPKGPIPGKRLLQQIVAYLNAIRLGRVVTGQTPNFDLSTNGAVWTVPNSSVTQNGSNTSESYRGEYDPGGSTTFNPGPFNFGDIVRVTPGNAVATTEGGTVVPGVYVCIQAGATSDDLPNHPLSAGGETAFWQWLATYPSNANVCNNDGSTTAVFVDQQNGTAS